MCHLCDKTHRCNNHGACNSISCSRLRRIIWVQTCLYQPCEQSYSDWIQRNASFSILYDTKLWSLKKLTYALSETPWFCRSEASDLRCSCCWEGATDRGSPQSPQFQLKGKKNDRSQRNNKKSNIKCGVSRNGFNGPSLWTSLKVKNKLLSWHFPWCKNTETPAN